MCYYPKWTFDNWLFRKEALRIGKQKQQTMKNANSDAGIRYVLKGYHETMLVVLEERGQTHAEAAVDLGISVSTFQKILRLQSLPNFHTERGKVLAGRFEEWSTLRVEQLFPEAFFTKEFLRAPKTITRSMPFRLLLVGNAKNGNFNMALLPSSKSEKIQTRKKRKKHKTMKN